MSEGRTKRSARNALSGFLYQGVTLILSFASRTVFLKTLGTEYLGLNGIFGDVLQLLSMADLGFGTAMAYSFYKPLAENDKERISELICFYKRLYHIVALVVLGLGLLCVPFLQYIVKTETPVKHLTIYYLFSLADVVISYLFVYKTTLMTADQKDYKLVNIRMYTSVAKTLIQILCLLAWHSYFGYLALGVISNFLTNVIATKKTEQEYPYLVHSKKNQKTLLETDLKANIFENMKSMFIYKLSTTIFSATDNILISMLVSTAMVGFYSNYLLLSNKLLLVEQIVFSAMTASIGNVIAKENAKKRYEVFESIQSASFIFSGIITVGFAVVVNDVIRVWLGTGFLLDIKSVIAITINNYLACVLTPLWVYRQATGLYMKTKYIMAIGAGINIVLSVVLGKWIGLAGIIVASAIARLSTYFWYEPKLLFQEYFESSSKKYYVDLLKHVLVITVMIVGLSFLVSHISVRSWAMLFTEIILVGGISTVVFLVAYHRTPGYQTIVEKVKQFLHRK